MADASARTRYCSRCLTTFIGELDRCPNLGCGQDEPAGGWGQLLEPGDVFDRHYVIERRLAIGGAGVTYLGREVDAGGESVGPPLAIKVLYVQRDQGAFLRRLSNEAQILQELDHPGIVQCMGFVHRHGHSPYLLTRFEAGGSLLDLLRRSGALGPRAAAAIGVQLCDALEVAHARGVIHRDIKPENVLLRAPEPVEGRYRVCLTDFGIAKVSGGVGGRLTKVGAFVGTPRYAAPEQFRGLDPTAATDVYALGAVLHFLVGLRPVLDDGELSQEQQLERLGAVLPPRIARPGLGPDEMSLFNAVLASAMAFEPGERGSIGRVRELLRALFEDRPRVVSSETRVPDLAAAGELAPLTAVEPPGGTAQDTFAGILSAEETEDDEEAPDTFDLEEPLREGSPDEDARTPAPRGGVLGCLLKGLAGAAVLGLLGLVGLSLLGREVWERIGEDRDEVGEEEPLELLPGDPGYERVTASVARQAEVFGRCGVRGEATLRLTFSAAGEVTSARVSGLSPTDAACLEGLASAFLLDWEGAGSAVVEAPLSLE